MDPKETGKIGGKIPGVRGPNGRKDAAADGGAKIGTAEASPETAGREPAATTAGTRGGPNNGGGEPLAGGTQIRAGRAARQAPELHVDGTARTNKVVTSDGEAAQEQQLAEG